MGSNPDTLFIGVDEAGRGPILGDLVIGLVVLNSEQLGFLKNIGVRDSKELSPQQREFLINHIRENSVLIHTVYIPPFIIDKFNLNKLLAKTVVSIVRSVLNILGKNYSEDTLIKIYIDEIAGYSDFIKLMISKSINRKTDIVVEKNADKKYTAVSAASIVAKYYRDKSLYSFKKIYGDFGSGYPVDRRTRSWIEEYYRVYKDPPLIIRRSWNTLSILAPKWYYNLKQGRSILDYVRKGSL